jgi:hypothetical protein
MIKKPLILNKKKIIVSIDLDITKKLIEQALKNIKDYYILYEDEFIEFLSKVFIYEPKLVIISKKNFEENINYAKHIRNNEYFKDLKIITIFDNYRDNTINQKIISSLNIKVLSIPVNTNELIKTINEYLN